jgi:hypothetical protein
MTARVLDRRVERGFLVPAATARQVSVPAAAGCIVTIQAVSATAENEVLHRGAPDKGAHPFVPSLVIGRKSYRYAMAESVRFRTLPAGN